MIVRRTLIAAAAGALLVATAAPLFAASTAEINAAIADAKRPQADKDRDAVRHPAELLAFSNVKMGDKVAELVPGGGYLTRMLSKVVGPSGHIYATNMPTLNERFKTGVSRDRSLCAQAAQPRDRRDVTHRCIVAEFAVRSERRQVRQRRQIREPV